MEGAKKKSANFVISRKTDIDCILKNMVIILMMSAKMGTPGFLKTMVF